jgi:hypothetical protein
MTNMQIGLHMSELAGVENRLASTLNTTTDQVSRMECLDQEQRAEIYTILKAIQQDTQVHQAMVDALAKLGKP